MDTLLCPHCGSSSITNNTRVYVLCQACGEESLIPFEDCLTPAGQGDKTAQCLLGSYYLGDDGVPEDYERALFWASKSFEQGYAPSYRLLGFMYERGMGVEKDIRKCHELYMAGAELDDLYCIYNTGIVYLNSLDMAAEAIPYLRKAAERELTEAQTQLAECYRRGLGLDKDDRQALRWALSAAEKGSPVAQFYAGLIHEESAVIEQDMDKAMYWYNRAIEGGNARAMTRAAYFYEAGEGVEQDMQKSFALYQAAADQGEWDAQCNLAWFYDTGTCVEQDSEEAFSLYMISAEEGYPRGMWLVGVSYMEGDGVEQDLEEAEYWIARVAHSDSPQTERARERLAELRQMIADQERTVEQEDDVPRASGGLLGKIKGLFS